MNVSQAFGRSRARCFVMRACASPDPWTTLFHWSLVVLLAFVLAACGGGGGGGNETVAQPTLAITSQPADQSTTPGATATFRIAVTGEVAVQWQRLGTDGQWVDIPGATGAELVLHGLTEADDRRQFRAQVRASGATVVLTSSIVTLRVMPVLVAPEVVSQPTDLQLRVGQVPRFSVTATGTAVTYQWQASADGLAWTDVADAITETLVLPAATLVDSGRLYRAVVRNAAASVTSRAVTLGVLPALQRPLFTSQPEDSRVESGHGTTFTATSSGEPVPTLQWETSLDGQSWTAVAGATSSTLVVATTTLADDGRRYRAVASNSEGNEASAAARLTVFSVAAAPTFIRAPQATAVTVAQAVSFEAQAVGTPTPTYQWQVSTDGGLNFTNVNGATGTQLSLPTTSATDDGRLFRVVASNRMGDVASPAARLTVYSPPQVTVQPRDVTSGAADAAVTVNVAGTGLPVPSVQWQVSRDNGATYQDISGATGNSYTWSPTRDDDRQLVRAKLSNTAGVTYSQAARIRKARWVQTSPTFVTTSLTAVRWLDTQVAVAVGYQGVIVRTADAGLTWQYVREPTADMPPYTRIAVLDGSTVVAAGSGGVMMRSDDAGVTWRSVRLPTTGWINSLSFRNASIGVMSSYNEGVFRTVDGGFTWTRVPPADPAAPFDHINSMELRGMLGFATGKGGWYRSTDGGASWNNVSLPFGLEGVSAYGNVSFIDDQSLIITGWGTVRSADGGLTWQAVSAVDNNALPWSATRFSADGQFGIDISGEKRSVDRGQTWMSLNGPPPFPLLADIDLGPGNVALAVSQAGELRRSIDQGVTWSVPYGSQGLNGVEFWGVEFPANDGHGIAFGNKGLLTALYQTADGGLTWQPLLQLTSVAAQNPVVHFIDAQVGMATIADGPLLRTTDGGRTWQQMPAHMHINNNGLAMINRDTVLMSSLDGMFRSTDGGNTWTNTLDTVLDPQRAPERVSARAGVALAPTIWGPLYRSTDGGQTWSTGSYPSIWPVSMAWASNTTVFILGSHGTLLRSDDAGLTWRQVLADTVPQQLFEAIRFSADGRMGVIVSTGTIYRSSDGGETWNRDLAGGAGWWHAIGFAGSRSPVVVGMDGAVAVGTGY